MSCRTLGLVGTEDEKGWVVPPLLVIVPLTAHSNTGGKSAHLQTVLCLELLVFPERGCGVAAGEWSSVPEKSNRWTGARE